MKKHLLLIGALLFVFVSGTKAQWAPCGTGLEHGPNVMLEFNNQLIIAGSVDSAGGIPVNELAAWNGNYWSAFGPGGPDYSFNELCIYNGNLYIGGYFNQIGGDSAKNIAMWNGSHWVPLGTGVDGSVKAMAVYNNELYVSGGFSYAGGVNTGNIARWNGTNWSAAGGGFYYAPSDLAVYNGDLYAGGSFPSHQGEPMQYVAKWNGTVWDSVKTSDFNGDVYTLEVYNGKLYVGGNFDWGNYNYIAYWDGSNWYACGTGMDDVVNDLAVFNGELYAGGNFYKADGVARDYLARWNGTSWNNCGTQPNEEVICLTTYAGKLYASGYFDNLGRYIASFAGPTGIDDTYLTADVNIFPNPSTGIFSIEIPFESTSVLRVFNSLGEEVYSTPAETGRATVDLSKVNPGIYFVHLCNGNETVRKKILLE